MILKHFELYHAIFSFYLGLSQSISIYVSLSWSILVHLGLSRSNLVLLGLSQSISVYLDLSWTILVYLVLSLSIWVYLCLSVVSPDFKLCFSSVSLSFICLQLLSSHGRWCLLFGFCCPFLEKEDIVSSSLVVRSLLLFSVLLEERVSSQLIFLSASSKLGCMFLGIK